MSNILVERLSPTSANIVAEGVVDPTTKKKTFYMEGIFIQGDKRNHNGRVYPLKEISRAVDNVNERIARGESILGEVDHPDNLTINLDRVSHVITEMKMDGSNGIGKLKIIEDMPMGKICKILLESGVVLGVSSRGKGEMSHDNVVRNFEMITVDIVAQPSAPDAYPKAIMEALQGYSKYYELDSLSHASAHDKLAEKFYTKSIIDFINEIKLY